MPAAANAGDFQLCPSLGMSSAVESCLVQGLITPPVLGAASIPGRSMGKCPQRPDLLVAIWTNSFVTTALQFHFSVCSVLLPPSPLGLDPKDSPLNFVYANLRCRVCLWGTHPTTMVSNTNMIPVLTELRGWPCHHSHLCFLPRTKQAHPTPIGGAHRDTCKWPEQRLLQPQHSLQPSLRQEWS